MLFLCFNFNSFGKFARPHLYYGTSFTVVYRNHAPRRNTWTISNNCFTNCHPLYCIMEHALPYFIVVRALSSTYLVIRDIQDALLRKIIRWIYLQCSNYYITIFGIFPTFTRFMINVFPHDTIIISLSTKRIFPTKLHHLKLRRFERILFYANFSRIHTCFWV